MKALTTSFLAARELGPEAILSYARYQLKLRTGWLRWRTPVRSWEDERDAVRLPLPKPPQLGVPLGLGRRSDRWKPAKDQAIAEGEAVLAGRFRLFGTAQVELGFPPDWHRFPALADGSDSPSLPPNGHWTATDLEAAPADIKLLWEPSRFGWLYSLVRAYYWSEDQRFVRSCWRLLESWVDQVRPNEGPHWFSAQEAAYRLLALCFARGALGAILTEDAERHRWLAGLICAHARRIPPTLEYSRAQGNNHLLSEATALYVAGLHLPGQQGARRWRHLGRKWLERALADQIFSDGGYVQYSTNYARLALQLGLLGVATSLEAGEGLAADAVAALRRLALHLHRLTDPATGQLPNFGPNDGTYLLPLTTCSFQDYRPTLQAASALLGDLPGLGTGPWDELSHWLGKEPVRTDGDHPVHASFPQAGLHLMEGQGTRIILRAADFQGRPGHADQMHLDLWRRSENLALDPGSYLYNGDPPWDNGLASAFVHNTVVLDEREPMKAAGRFLWLDWTKARLIERIRGQQGLLEFVVAQHEVDALAGLRHRRSVLRVAGAHCLVVDDLLGQDEHQYLVPWLLPAGDWNLRSGSLLVRLPGGTVQVSVDAPGGRQALYRAGERIAGEELKARPQWGWTSPSYGQLVPALHWLTAGEGKLPLQVRTWWSFEGADPAQVQLEWRTEEAVPSIRRVRFEDASLEL